jgi:hypothetical protein
VDEHSEARVAKPFTRSDTLGRYPGCLRAGDPEWREKKEDSDGQVTT